MMRARARRIMECIFCIHDPPARAGKKAAFGDWVGVQRLPSSAAASVGMRAGAVGLLVVCTLGASGCASASLDGTRRVQVVSGVPTVCQVSSVLHTTDNVSCFPCAWSNPRSLRRCCRSRC